MARLSLYALALLVLCAVTVTGVSAANRRGQRSGYSRSIASHATFYGNFDASGTMGGACGYGNLYTAGYGTQTAAASTALYNDGHACGACFRVRCTGSKYCRPGASTIVTVTNHCPQGSEGGWCDGWNPHLDMSYPAWAKIATDPKAGVVNTIIRRVPCPVAGGIKFTVNGNPFWIMLLITNVGGPGDVGHVHVRSGNTWVELNHNWGAVYSGSNFGSKSPVHFRVLSATGRSKALCWNALPASWSFGTTYQANCQFAV